MVSRQDVFENIANEAIETYKRKNKDYGSSYTKTFDKYGNVAGIIPILNKVHRLESLIEKNSHEVDESLQDSLLDLANYALMFLTELEYRGAIEEKSQGSNPTKITIHNTFPEGSVEGFDAKHPSKEAEAKVREIYLKHLFGNKF